MINGAKCWPLQFANIFNFTSHGCSNELNSLTKQELWHGWDCRSGNCTFPPRDAAAPFKSWKCEFTWISHNEWNWHADFALLEVVLWVWSGHDAEVFAIVIACYWLEIESTIIWDEYVPLDACSYQICKAFLVPSIRECWRKKHKKNSIVIWLITVQEMGYV